MELKVLQQEVIIYSNSQSAIHLCKNSVFCKRSKHIQVKYHLIRDMVSQNALKVEKIPIELNPSNMGTITLPMSKFNNCKNLFNIKAG